MGRTLLQGLLGVVCVAALACDNTRAVTVTLNPPRDAGLEELADASEPDAGEFDAGELDAGVVEAPDAGEVDAGPITPPVGPFPIILMHGMGGFNNLENLPITFSYFSGVQADLQGNGEPLVFVTIAPPYDTSEHRAAVIAPQIRDILRQTGAAKVNLIAHSQGGLDARVLASPDGLNMGDVIASVTTIATPHRGSPVADLALGLTTGVPAAIAGPVANAFLQLLENGVYPVQTNPDILAQAQQLSSPYMENTFNPKYRDAPNVIYESYAGRTNLARGNGDCDNAQFPNHPDNRDVPQAFFVATASYMSLRGEPSDGLVPIASAKWGTFMQCVPADHLKEVGMVFQNGPDWISGFDHLAFFRRVVKRLRLQGL
jgi:triacylglycerol lipase